MARVSDFFSKESKSQKIFLGGDGKGGLARVSEYVLQRNQILKFCHLEYRIMAFLATFCITII